MLPPNLTRMHICIIFNPYWTPLDVYLCCILYSFISCSFITTPPLFALWQCQSQAWVKEEDDANGLCCHTALLQYCSFITMHPSAFMSACLSICLSVYLSVSLSLCKSVYLPACVHRYVSVYPCMYVRLSVSVSRTDSVCLSVYLRKCLSAFLSVLLPSCLPAASFTVSWEKSRAVRDFQVSCRIYRRA